MRSARQDPDHGLEADLEADLMSRLSEFRQRGPNSAQEENNQQSRGVGGMAGDKPALPEMQWDMALSHLLMPALEAYEHVRGTDA